MAAPSSPPSLSLLCHCPSLTWAGPQPLGGLSPPVVSGSQPPSPLRAVSVGCETCPWSREGRLSSRGPTAPGLTAPEPPSPCRPHWRPLQEDRAHTGNPKTGKGSRRKRVALQSPGRQGRLGVALCEPRNPERLQTPRGDFASSCVRGTGSNFDHGYQSVEINVPSAARRTLNLGYFPQNTFSGWFSRSDGANLTAQIHAFAPPPRPQAHAAHHLDRGACHC